MLKGSEKCFKSAVEILRTGGPSRDHGLNVRVKMTVASTLK